MPNQHTASYQISAFLRRGWLPASTPLTTADILAYFNEEQRLYLTALLKSVREEYLVREADHDVTIVASTPRYRIPTRCVGAALRSVRIVGASNASTPLTRIEPENSHLYPGTGAPYGYMLRGNTIQLLPTPQGSGTLRLSYLQRLSTIVEAAACGEIATINPGAGSLTVSAAPATFTSSVTYDLCRGTPGFETLAIDQAATVAGTTITFTSGLPTDLAVGDFVALAGETPIPQVPLECHALLAQRVALVIADDSGSATAQGAAKKLERMEKDLQTILSQRVTGSARPVINPSGPGMRRRS